MNGGLPAEASCLGGKVGARCRALRANFWYNCGMNYQVIIHDAEDGGYWAEVTGMPGCYSQSETLMPGSRCTIKAGK